MALIERFEDVWAWQQARELTKQIYRISNEGTFAKDFGLRSQVQRAAVSAMSNIAEGRLRLQDRVCPVPRHRSPLSS